MEKNIGLAQTEETLLRHLARYPGMEPEDAIKLLYQSEFGVGHLIADEDAFAGRLAEELAQPGLFTASPPLPEAVGGGWCRVHLSALGGGPGAATLARLCVLSAQKRGAGSGEGLRSKLALLGRLAGEGRLPWPAEKVQDATAGYTAAATQDGGPIPRHSHRYRGLYHPHYRLMDCGMAAFLPLFRLVDSALAQKPHVLVGVDGMSASGKSTLAGLMQQVYRCGVVHADHFFLRPEQRTPARLALPGGNIDHERLAPVAAMAAGQEGFRYQAYNCQTGEMDEWHSVPEGPLTVLEGAYALHPRVGAPCDVRVFLAVDAKAQMERIAARNGEEAARRFKEEWIPMENAYFARYAVREGADLILYNG